MLEHTKQQEARAWGMLTCLQWVQLSWPNSFSDTGLGSAAAASSSENCQGSSENYVSDFVASRDGSVYPNQCLVEIIGSDGDDD